MTVAFISCVCLREAVSIVSCCLHSNNFRKHPLCFSASVWLVLQCSCILILITGVNSSYATEVGR